MGGPKGPPKVLRVNRSFDGGGWVFFFAQRDAIKGLYVNSVVTSDDHDRVASGCQLEPGSSAANPNETKIPTEVAQLARGWLVAVNDAKFSSN